MRTSVSVPIAGRWAGLPFQGGRPTCLGALPLRQRRRELDVILALTLDRFSQYWRRFGEMTGIVLDHAGQPATGAKVILVDVQKLRVRDGVTGWWFGRLGDQFQNDIDTADSSGRFTLSGDPKATEAVVVVSADARMVWAVANNGANSGVKIQLPEPATINVRYDIPGDAPEAQLRFDLLCDEVNNPGASSGTLTYENKN